jgi:hypothetical protein
MFDSVDIRNDGIISLDEWLQFWATVKSHGHTDSEIMEELERLDNHESWVCFNDMP